jgi:hypothetical protein
MSVERPSNFRPSNFRPTSGPTSLLTPSYCVLHTSLFASSYCRPMPGCPAILTSCALRVVVLRNTILQSCVLRTVVVHLVVLCPAAYLTAFCRSTVL